MKQNRKMAYNLLNKIVGLKARNVKQGHGSFISLEFGKDIEYESIIKGKKEIKKRGEWYLWVTMCSWRIDERSFPLAGCEDSRDTIKKALKQLENKKLTNIEILSNAFDMKLEFNNSINFFLFSIYTEKESDVEHWILFTPDRKSLIAGPSTMLKYENSGE